MLERFKSKLSRRSNSSSRPVNSSSSIRAPEPLPEKLGLIPLFPGEGQPDVSAPITYPVDIIAIHGLNGDAYSTWTHFPEGEGEGKLWLRDILPGFLPGCRVYTYGYPSKVFSDSFAGVHESARLLLAHIRDIQDDPAIGQRPIIFVCHSLGGIVCKQALVIAHEDDNLYGLVLKSVIGVVFLGTPHGGSGVADIVSVFATIVNTFTVTASAGIRHRTARTDLLDHIRSDSKALYSLVLAARNRLAKLSVVSFFENYPIAPLSSLIVDQKSATLGIPNEEVIPLNEDHRTICRFSGETTSYKLVANALKRIASVTAEQNSVLQRSETHSSSRSLSEAERACVRLLYTSTFTDEDEDLNRSKPPTPTPGTCQWIRTHNAFVSWLERSSNALLWLTGHPGCGKTILSFALAQYFRESWAGKKSHNVLFHFCDSTHGKQTDARIVLISLILQIINRRHSMIRYVRRVFEMQGQSMTRSFSALWGIFLQIVRDPRAGSFYVILDALDECEKSSCRQLLESISGMLADSQHSAQSSTIVKFLITSRPFFHRLYASANQILRPQISIDEGQAGYVADLHNFIEQRVEELSLNRRYPSDVKEYLLNALRAKADQSFLWIHVVLVSLEESLMTSVKDIQTLIGSIPDKLADTYTQYLATIPSGHQDHAAQFLKLLLASSRPLHLNEINIAFTINASHATNEDVTRDTQSSMDFTIQGVLGPLARVSEYHVSLIHQSLKEFLLDAGKIPGSFCATRLVNMEDSALQMASACMEYICLDDFSVDLFSPVTPSSKSTFSYSDLQAELLVGGFSEDFWDDEAHYLTSDTLFREPDELNPEICNSINSKYGFYSYASLHWAEHFALCEGSASDRLKEMAKTLLNVESGYCRNWLQFHRTQSTDLVDNLTSQHAIVLAAYFNLHRTLQDLLDSCDATESVKNRGLYWASRLGHDQVVTVLLVAGANPNSQEIERQTAVTTASEHGNLSCISALVGDKRTNISGRGRHGRSALSFASGNGHIDIVTELLSRDCSNADDTDASGFTPFLWAVGGGHRSIVSALARHPNVNINHRDKTGRTAVSWAAGDGMVDILKDLLRLRGIDVNIKDKGGKSPLSWAAGNGCTDTVEVLLRNRAVDIASVDKDKRSAISWACGGGHHDALIKLLDRARWGVDTEDIDGWTPLAWGIQKETPKTVEALISTGSVQIERRDRSGRTALSWAVAYGHMPVVKTLLQAGADPGARDDYGRTPLSIARQLGRDDLVGELQKHIVEDIDK